MSAPRLPRALAGVLALATALGATPARAVLPPPPSDSLLMIRTARYEVHARDRRDLHFAAQRIEYVGTQVESITGLRPPRMRVVIFDTPERASQEAARFRSGEWPLVTWVGAIRSDDRTARRPGRDLAAAFAHHLGHAFFEAAARARQGHAAPGPNDAEDGSISRHTGLAGVPDWFDEAVAGMCEPPASQLARVSALRGALDRRIPFATLFVDAYPTAPLRGELFTNESVSLLRFLLDREDDLFVRRMSQALVKGRPIGEVLTDAREVYSKPEPLERQWLAWMRSSAALGVAVHDSARAARPKHSEE